VTLVVIMQAMSDPIQRLVAFAKRLEPSGGYFGPETLVDQLYQNSHALAEFRSLFDGVTAEQLDPLEDQEEYGWIIAGAADELDLLPDDPRLFKSEDQLAAIPDDKLIGELRSACILNDVRATEYIARRVNVNQLDHNKQLPIAYAVGNNNFECVKLLLGHGADPNCVQNWGNTTMHICASTASSKEIWQLLIAHGGNPESQNDDGKSARQLLQDTGRSDWMA
jgi:hypothetical protein